MDSAVPGIESVSSEWLSNVGREQPFAISHMRLVQMTSWVNLARLGYIPSQSREVCFAKPKLCPHVVTSSDHKHQSEYLRNKIHDIIKWRVRTKPLVLNRNK